MKKEFKIEYKKLFENIRKIINDIDPESLSPGQEGGAPVDEYDREVESILSFLIHNQEEIKVRNHLLIEQVNKIWQESFGSKCSKVEMMVRDLLKIIF